MSWPEQRLGLTDPEYYRDAADDTERQLRADFAHHCYLLELLPYAETGEQAGEFQHWADQLATQWGQHDDPRWRQLWADAHAAKASWESRLDDARRTFRELEQACADSESLAQIAWRTARQAREITGHDHTTPVAGSTQDTYHRPQFSLSVSAEPAAATTADGRTAVQKTLGAPRTTAPERDWSALDRVDAVLAATEHALAEEETVAVAEERSRLLPREVREAPIHWDYSTAALWESRQALLLRQLQDLTAEHAIVVDSFTETETTPSLQTDPVEDQARIDRLEQLQTAISAARLDALRAGVPQAEVDHAYLLGRDGIRWSVEPGSHRLGRIAQLTEQRDHARAETDTLHTRVTELQRQLDLSSAPDTKSQSLSATEPSAPPGVGADGTGIGTAIDTALPERHHVDWHVAHPYHAPPDAQHGDTGRTYYT
ncbi:hypothetical protein [Nocardia blacklockiae]|uniref:hypothetical protein n=1 Tax=Nocardia blacklockiae TaxID=480036 RepID=UPI001894B1FE|nr:hypothetical protein [Nocardia blacklockiae]MBF6176035.1 hypothetical protein [Nocardia blacklockiae]